MARDGDRAHARGARGRAAEEKPWSAGGSRAPASGRVVGTRNAGGRAVSTSDRARGRLLGIRQRSWFHRLRSEALLLKATGSRAPGAVLHGQVTMPDRARRDGAAPAEGHCPASPGPSARRRGDSGESRAGSAPRASCPCSGGGHHEQRLEEHRRLDALSSARRKSGRQRGTKKSSGAGRRPAPGGLTMQKRSSGAPKYRRQSVPRRPRSRRRDSPPRAAAARCGSSR
jgi:hypothetical protein